MYEKKGYDSAPMYSPPSYFSPPTSYRPSGEGYDYGVYSPQSHQPGSYYIKDEPQHFYKWTSPPGIIRILGVIIIILCVGIFACVASTLAWDSNYGYGSGLGGAYSGAGYYGSLGMGSYLGGYGGYGYYGTYTSPQAAKGFMIAMAAICFIFSLAFFVMSVSKSESSRSRKFYLIMLVFCAILAVLQLIATIVYIMGVNPYAQGSGTYYQVQIQTLCSQYYAPMAGGAFVNQYLYHYCIVEPQEAIAMVCGFLVSLAYCIICVFAQKTRHKIWKYGKPNIYWKKPFADVNGGPDVEEWVNNVASNPDEGGTVVLSEKSQAHTIKSASEYQSYQHKENGNYFSENYNQNSYPVIEMTSAVQALNSSISDEAPKESYRKPAARRGRRSRRNPEFEDSQYETEYTTGADSCNEMDTEEWERQYPPITNDVIRQEYKKEFDSDLKQYKKLCAEMDSISDEMNLLNKQLDTLPEDSLQYQGVAEEYNRLKDLKRTTEYQTKKLQTKQLRNKLFHIKRMVKLYDKERA